MNISKEENLMYKVMKSIYDSGMPVSFKGSMVLKACLLEAGFYDDTRHTVDIDANWNSDSIPTTEQIAESFQNAINQANLLLDVNVYRQYGEGRSAGLELMDKDSKEILFTMDVDVNRPMPQTKIYEIEGLKFRGVTPSQIIADKVSVVSSEKVFRRIKDVIDLYYLSNAFEFDYDTVLETLKNSGRSLGNFDGFLNRTEDLEHSYTKFRFAGGINKPTFDEVYQAVKGFIDVAIQQSKTTDREY